jgi:hypothetical protein
VTDTTNDAVDLAAAPVLEDGTPSSTEPAPVPDNAQPAEVTNIVPIAAESHEAAKGVVARLEDAFEKFEHALAADVKEGLAKLKGLLRL